MFEETETDVARAQGIYKQPPKKYTLVLDAADAHGLIELMKRVALDCKHYHQIREVVHYCELIEHQCLEQNRLALATRRVVGGQQ